MTPKEKAKELVKRYINLYPHPTEEYLDIDEAKQCALIAIDLILAINKEVWDDFHNEYFLFWVDVKIEIEKL
jgi:hypothetical protein